MMDVSQVNKSKCPNYITIIIYICSKSVYRNISFTTLNTGIFTISHRHFLAKAKCLHCQGILCGILGDDSHGFVHGIRVAMSTELMLCYSSF
jgi:hypothetical protein